ncbi:Rieske (2Fe-2S) protein [Acaryochloris sp. CCMEE 5410]|uniref:Rieske (2Fe-2S) protein n=1 Tax=Acaryochloris sp. CCMEE 5410 TaxID=310037 RepID=UPI0002484774|nr:Rieske (2Fe-2S) protein [Acaryochloris sp. CCMEE 5410]KAI9132849.1 Rieske (2Fe-2S) protein [Acaryochloris sp. CCMEE 5410]
MSWVKVLSESELDQGDRQIVKVEKEKILLVNHGGNICAVKNACPHLKAPLSKGKITTDGAIVCPLHRSAFDLATGVPKSWIPWPPGLGKLLGAISKERPLQVYPTRVEEGDIWVEIAE